MISASFDIWDPCCLFCDLNPRLTYPNCEGEGEGDGEGEREALSENLFGKFKPLDYSLLESVLWGGIFYNPLLKC